MIKGQRSSSPPAPPHSSPPAVSPTITQLSSRSASPSPSDSQESSRRILLRSPSPPRSPSPRPQPSMMNSLGGESADGGDDELETRRPIMPPASMSAPVGHLPRLIPHDTSEYTAPELIANALPSTRTSLCELANLITKARYLEQRRCDFRIALHRRLVSSALSARLQHCGELAHRTLIDYFRNDDRKNFATLYNALYDVQSSCDATRRYALLEPELKSETPMLAKATTPPSYSTFMHEIPQKFRNEILAFIVAIRTDPNFLAACVASLTQSELISLASFRPASEPESIFPTAKSNAIAKKASFSAIPNPVERLLSFQRHDPLSALLYTCFANSAGPDSSEDRRRTDAWATTCARLITDARQGSDRLIKSVLDAWAGMRDWPAKANIELFLMEVLQDGQFLLDKTSLTEKELQYATDEFMDASVKKLFDVIDDEPSAGGMPEGVWEIGRRRPSSFTAGSSLGSCLTLLCFPSHDMMMGYHISTQARDKILRKVAMAVLNQASSVFWIYSGKLGDAPPILPEVRSHMENLLVRLRHPRPSLQPVLLEAKEAPSPRENSDVNPFLVVSPADIVTLVNSLFPERRPVSVHTEKDFNGRGLASSASSISGISIPFRATSTPGDGSSVFSMSVSSVTSDATSREPLLDPIEKSEETLQAISFDSSIPPKPVPTEEYGRRLRLACSEMKRLLGSEAIAGSGHPCAERWAVLFITQKGRGLKIRLQEDGDGENENDDDSPDTDSEDEAPGLGVDLENDYHQLKESVAKLLLTYELPLTLAPEHETKLFSLREAQSRQELKQRALRRADPTNRIEDMAINPQPKHPAPRVRISKPRSNSASETEDIKGQRTSDLVVMLQAALHQCQTRNDYVNALLWHRTLERLHKLTSPSLTRNGYAPLLTYFARGPRDSIYKSLKATRKMESWFEWLKTSQNRYETNVKDMMLDFKTLRDKMWFRTAVLTSAGYEEAKNLAVALKLMGQPSKILDEKPAHKPRQYSRSTANFLLRTETQVMDSIATVPDRAGPNKLVDEQVELTAKWLTGYGIENFCKGEERIHRFCLEIDKLVNKLVGESVIEAPVLWSSELFRRDKDILDSGRQKGDLWLTGVGMLSVAGDEEYEVHTGRPPPRSLDFVQSQSQQSLRSITTRASQQSFDSSSMRSSGSRGLNLMDAQDYFGAASPALSINPAITFWSPFQAGEETHKEIRPSTGAAAKGTVLLQKSTAVNQQKRRFLLDLKQTLTGLLLSDLGTLVFNKGSETDSWFSGDIGEECIQRKEAEERRRKQKLARKKSMRSLKSAASREQRATTLENVTRNDRDRSANPPLPNNQHLEHTHSVDRSSNSDATASANHLALRKAGLLEFPYDAAYRKLLGKFSTHPNPFVKLHALYELEQLIVADLCSKSGRYFAPRRDTLAPVPQSPTLGAEPDLSSRDPTVHNAQAKNLGEAIANVENRRSYSMNAHHHHSSGRESPSGNRSPNRLPSTDMVVDVLQGLFRDAEIRPKTLFRDLQFIAAFVPASMLDRTERGKAFWDAGLAALGLKQDVCRYMVEIADDIVAENTQSRTANHGGTTPTPESQVRKKWSMVDAAKMYIITAKEGDAAAERELAIFYLTHPDLLPRTLLPLSKPREIFKESLLNQKREDPERSDPMTMCVAHHWMELSKKGGDELATKYLRARDDMEKIP
ncbi:hypothetical protein E6O75_ATG02157 [Venturia nashicola]|uniref:Uncharacterized protein n=1 Tax=Venturia nashicola TaxID=86259 RepID=A0A4Z1P2P3_9PEZI|nr:hypothetical protein E6O75_ATG02157 [Venturia nashicola]